MGYDRLVFVRLAVFKHIKHAEIKLGRWKANDIFYVLTRYIRYTSLSIHNTLSTNNNELLESYSDFRMKVNRYTKTNYC